MITCSRKRSNRSTRGLARLLGAIRAGELTAARLKDLIAVSRSWEAKVTALQTDGARLIAQQESHGDGGASVLRDQAGKSKHQARRSLGTAEVLDEMPGLRAAVDSGEVALANAERLADAAQRTAPEAVDGAADLLAMAKEMAPDKFAREASAWAQRHQSDHGHGDWLDKRRQRYLKTWRLKDGSVRLDGLLDPETGTRICNRLQSTAEQLRRQDQQSARTNSEDSGLGPAPSSGSALADGGQTAGEGLAFGDGLTDSEGSPFGDALADSQSSAAGGGPRGGEGLRSWDQLRADALDLLTSGDAEGPKAGGGSGGRPKAEIIAVADIGVLTSENPAGRCEIPGAGPLPPEVLQRIACDAQLTGVIFADGKPLHHGSTVRTATGAQWRMLIARDRGCIGCGTSPERCQAHHIVPYARSRRTDIDNLVLVCWRCHHNIHDHHWRVVHQNGKPALQPPDPSDPPNLAYGRRPRGTRSQRPSGGSGGGPADGPARDTRQPRPQRPPRSPRPAKTRTRPAPNRAGPDPPAGGPDPPPQTPALFTI